MKLIFLDIDGVLNDHKPHPNGYSGMTPRCVEQFNRILKAVPDAEIVLTSAWRYICLAGDMTVKGFENLMATHGVEAHGRLRGWTCSDEEICGTGRDYEWLKANGCQIRCEQIEQFYAGADLVIIDDLPLDFSPSVFVQTNGNIGLTEAVADHAIAILKGQPE